MKYEYINENEIQYDVSAFEEGKQIEYLKAYVEIFDSLPQGPET